MFIFNNEKYCKKKSVESWSSTVIEVTALATVVRIGTLAGTTFIVIANVLNLSDSFFLCNRSTSHCSEEIVFVWALVINCTFSHLLFIRFLIQLQSLH